MKNQSGAAAEVTTVKLNQIFLCNKFPFIKHTECPMCRNKVNRKNVKIDGRIYSWGRPRYFYSKQLFFCQKCNLYYITPENLTKLNNKAFEKRGFFDFCEPANVSIHHYKEDVHYVLKPDSRGFNSKHLWSPYYEMSDTERFLYEDEYIYSKITFNSSSFLSDLGYSVSVAEYDRRRILSSAVDKYGKSPVVSQINFNIRMREAQKNSSKYANAISVWKTDVEYVNGLIDTFEIREREESEKHKQKMLEEMRKAQELEIQKHKQKKYPEPKREWAWWEHENVKILE